METKELLRVNHLKKYFQTPHGTLSAVDDVTFGINERETLGVVAVENPRWDVASFAYMSRRTVK